MRCALLALSTSFAHATEADVAAREPGLIGDLLQLPYASSTLLQATIFGQGLLFHARQFVEHSKKSNGTRVFGSAGHNATVNYIKTLLDATRYYDTEIQTFPYLYSAGSATFGLSNGTTYSDVNWFTYGPGGDVTAPIILVDREGCETSNYAVPAVTGNIVLIKRGTCTFSDKVARAGAAGAAGVIIYNNVEGTISGTLGEIVNPLGPYVPAASVTNQVGLALVAAIEADNVIGHLKVNAQTETRYTSNVLATTKNGDKKNVVLVGGHTDSVAAGPGINDDGSGTMGILEVALRLPAFRVKNAVRFGFWTAEEFGLVGSEYYASSLTNGEPKPSPKIPHRSEDIALYLNFDMIASPNPGYFVFDGDGDAFNITGPAGSDHIEKTLSDFLLKNHKIKSAPTAFDGRSDYGSFIPLGIPAGGYFTGAEGIMSEERAKLWGGKAGVAYDKCYHKQCDGIDNLNVPAWVINTKGIAHAVATYAKSLDGIPRGQRVAKEIPVSRLSYDERKHYSCGEEILTS
ncbi:hypothetical protein D9619_009067 [Psilocybe cf. subviscida]|uniref:Peptide hydrolase n=1 Tax=Psilocybe cf. subviscida TaxID=2480587 RepID=A0A8H5BUJ2_9AGAR|nr:hypothetical protein D9619_009067 [Psilocybe cf. subviscida]